MTKAQNKTRKIPVSLDPRDYEVVEQLAEQRRSFPATIVRELVGKAIDAGLAK